MKTYLLSSHRLIGYGRGGPTVIVVLCAHAGLTALTFSILRLIQAIRHNTQKVAIRLLRVSSMNAIFVALTWSGVTFAGEDVEFAAATRKGDLDKVKVLLKANPDLVFLKLGGDHWTPLHMAAGCGHKDMVEFFLTNKADPNAKDSNGNTPLNWAASLAYKDVAELLLANGADYTILDVASLGDIEKVKALLKANPELVLSKDQLGLTPLHRAVMWRRQDTVEFLLANKADVNARDKCNATPLMYAAVRGLKDVVKLLLANDAEVNARDHEGYSAFHHAVEYKHPDVAELLRKHGGNDWWTDFRNAIVHDRLVDFKALLKDHPDLVFSRFIFGKTALRLAVEYDRKEMVKLLLDNKADVNAKADDGTPLKIAVYLDHKEVAELLRQRGGHE